MSGIITDISGKTINLTALIREELRSALSETLLQTVIKEGGVEVDVDENIGALTVILTEHRFIHKGYHFFVEDYDSDVDEGTINAKRWLIKTPDNSTRIHLFFDTSSTGGGLWELFEDPIVITNGDTLQIHNNDRNSIINPEVIICNDPTISDDGNRLMIIVVPSTGGKAGAGAELSRENEIILKQNEEYIFKFTASLKDTGVSIRLFWYEIR